MKQFVQKYGFYAFAAFTLCLFLSGFDHLEAKVFCFLFTFSLFVEKFDFDFSQSSRDQERNEHDNVVQLDSYRNR